MVTLLRPHFENFSKRLVKAPKLYFVDTGLICRLLGVRSPEDLRTHPLRGAIFENLIVSEFRKLYLHDVKRPPLHFWRDANGLEVDLLVDLGTRRIPIEIKAGQTVNADYFKGLDKYTKLSGDPSGIVVYGGDESGRPTQPPDSSLVELHVVSSRAGPSSRRGHRFSRSTRARPGSTISAGLEPRRSESRDTD